MSYKGTLITSPINPTGNFPAVWDEDFGGGYRIVNNLTELLAISLEKIKLGMPVYVISEQKEYRYNNSAVISPDIYTTTVASNLITDWTEIVYVSNVTSNVIDITYNDLKASILSSDLQIGNFYRIIDFNTTLYDAFSNPTITYAAVEPLIVQALSSTHISIRAQSEQNQDEILLDISDLSLSDALYGAVQYTGKIIYRKDALAKLEAPYDFRKVEIRKWAINSGAPSNVYYDCPYPWQGFDFTTVAIGPHTSISIDITEFGIGTTTHTITPTRYMMDIYDVCKEINMYFNNNGNLLYGNKAEIVNNKLYMYLTDFNISLNPIYLYSSLTITDVLLNTYIALNNTNNYPGNEHDSFKFLTFNQDRTTSSTIVNNIRCSNISIQPIHNIVYPMMIPNVVSKIDLNPLRINNICFNNLSKNIITNGRDSIIDSSDNIIMNGDMNRIKNCIHCNIDGRNNYINGNVCIISGEQIYVVNSINCNITRSNYISCQDSTGLRINQASNFTIPAGIVNKILDGAFSTFEATVDITIGIDNIINIPNENYGIIFIDYPSDVNINKIKILTNIYNVDFTIMSKGNNITLFGNSVLVAPIANSMILSSSQFTILKLNESYIKFRPKNRGNLNFMEIETKTYI